MTTATTTYNDLVKKVVLDMNEAAVLASLAKKYMIENDADLTEGNKYHWNLLIQKLTAF
jgi:hypothetical protein